jgi:hypothetical protein
MHRVDTALFAANNAVTWHRIGEVRANSITWASHPLDTEKHLGEYLARVDP